MFGPMRVVFLALGLVLPSGCAPEPAPRASFSGMNLILISVDTLRADRLGCYGYERPTSPAIDDLAESGVRFERVVAESSWTLPSHMTIFTGLHPGSHGVVTGNDKLPPGIPTLTEHLRARGYRTFGTTVGGWVEGRFGFSRGFETWDDEKKRLKDAIPQSLAWIDGMRSDEPYFLFLHTYDVHCPYDPPPPFVEQFRTRPPKDHLEVEKRCGNTYFNKLDLTQGQVRFLSDQYDAEIRAADEQLRGFFDELDRRGAWRDTIVVLLSDHGEEFYEHGQIGHERTLFIETLRVPLIVVAPGLEPGTVSRSAGLVDVFPTLAQMLELSPSGLHGESLLPWMRGASADHPDPPRFSQLDRHVELASIVRGDGHLILDRAEDTALLFDLSADPGEQEDLASGRPDEADALRSKIASHLASLPSPAEVEAVEHTPEQEERLRALGYVD
jgi:arylsulfatase A-like enzyme